MHFTKRDLVGSLFTGLTAGIIVWRLAVYLKGTNVLFGVPLVLLVVFIPLLWAAGVNLGYFLSKWFGFFRQFGRYAAIGFTNAAVDFGVFNLLHATSGVSIRERVWFVSFKAVSFIIAVLHSYFWNKTWAFEATESRVSVREVSTFFAVMGLALLVNTSVSYAVVQAYNPLIGIAEKIWANIGLVAGSAAALVFSFVGFKIIVFKK